MYQSVGWDWTPSVRDRNMGIWQHVWLEATGPVAVRDPAGFVDIKWTPGQDAPIKVRGYLDNPGQQSVSTDLTVRIAPEGFDGPAVEFKQNIAAAPGRNEFILLPTDHPELVLHNPKVWWPDTYGDHPLYQTDRQRVGQRQGEFLGVLAARVCEQLARTSWPVAAALSPAMGEPSGFPAAPGFPTPC